MNEKSTGNWANLLGSIGVLAGLILVAYELRQTNDIAEAETFRTAWEMVGELNRLAVETDIMSVFWKAENDPASLTDDNVNRLYAYFTLALEIQVVKAIMRDTYGLYPVSVEEQAADTAGFYFRGHFGRAWFDQNEDWIANYTPALARALRDHVDSTPVIDGGSGAEELRNEAVRRKQAH